MASDFAGVISVHCRRYQACSWPRAHYRDRRRVLRVCVRTRRAAARSLDVVPNGADVRARDHPGCDGYRGRRRRELSRTQSVAAVSVMMSLTDAVKQETAKRRWMRRRNLGLRIGSISALLIVWEIAGHFLP